MRRCSCVMLIMVILGGVFAPSMDWRHLVYARTVPRPAPILHIRAKPASISLGRDIRLLLIVTDARGRPVDNAVLSVTGLSRPVIGATQRGVLTLVVHTDRPGRVQVQASRSGYALARLTIPVVPGSPASIVAFRRGVSVLAPRHRPQPGAVGMDLWATYQAITGKSQYASLGLRDGTLMYMNSNTDVLITDPLHQRLSKGELFMEVVHGSASHQVQVGTAVAATKGTQLDVRVNPTTKVAQVTVAEGRVQVSATRGTVLVPAGQQTTIPPSGTPTRPRPVNVGALLSWLNNTPRSGRSVPVPTLTLPPPRVAPVPSPGAVPPPAITVTGAASTTTWSGGPYLVQGNLDVPVGTTLTIAPGTVLEMDPGAYVSVEGTLLARGTVSAPIVFSGITSRASVLDHVQIFYGGGTGTGRNNQADVYIINGTDPTIGNSAFAQSGSVGIYVDDGNRPTITGCVFGDNVDAPASLPPDDVALFTGNGFGAGSLGVWVRGGGLAQRSATWMLPDVPLIVQGNLDVPAGTTLTIAPGTVLEMDPGAYLSVEGTLLARGTVSAPIVFTSSQAQPRPGDWAGIMINGPGSRASVLDHVQVFYGGGAGSGYGIHADVWVRGGTDPTIGNSAFAQSGSVGIYVDDGNRPTITGCVFLGDNGPAISLPAKDPQYVHDDVFAQGQQGVQARD